MVRSVLPSLWVVLAGCGPGVEEAPLGVEPVGGGPIPLGLTDGLRAGAHQLREVDGALGFVGRARFETDGRVALPVGAEELQVTSVAWGRTDALVPAEASPAVKGACASGRVDAAGACLRRAEIARGGGLVEWWASDERGVEQGWTVAEAPPGEGDLVVDVAMGADVTVAADGASAELLVGGALVRYDGLVAWDATGRPLDAWLEAIPEGVRVRVDDAEASYPVVIDPVFDTSAWSAQSDAASAYFGTSVASAGDVNGDGYDDAIVGASGYSSSTGAAFVYHGSASGLSSTPALTLMGGATSDYYGDAVASAGDVNGDGYDDVVIGARSAGWGGEVYLHLGSASGLSSTPATTLGEGSIDFGVSVAGAGDVNADGYDDVIVGASRVSSNTGRAYVFLGSASGLSDSYDSLLYGPSSGAYFGISVSSAGDVDADGYDDVIVGANGYSSSTGRAYVYYGGPHGISSLDVTTLTGASSSSHFGYSVASAGDTNGDGYADVVIGAYYYSSGWGRAYVYRGAASGVSTTAATTLTASGSGQYFGRSVASAGDVDLDGYDDIVIGADYYSSSTGRAFLYRGSSAGIGSTADTTLTGTQAGASFGGSVASAGDVNGDGAPDLIVGSHRYDDGSSDEGAAFLFLANGTLELIGPDGGEAWAGGSTQTITWTGARLADATSYALYYSTDSGSSYPNTITTGLATTTPSYTWTVPALDSSTVRVKVVAVDPTGDITDESDADFTIDSTAPTAFDLTTPTNGAYGGPTATFDWRDATGASTYELWVDGVVVASDLTTSTYTLTSAEALSVGSHYWYVKAYDTAGNVRQSTSTWTVVVEATAPTAFSLISPADGAWIPEATNLQWAASSDAESGLDSYQLWVDGALCRSSLTSASVAVSTLSACGLEEGAHTWYVVALDEAGNTRSSTETWTFQLDTLAPGQLDELWTGYVYDTETAPSYGEETDVTLAVGEQLIVDASGSWYFDNDRACGSDADYEYTADGGESDTPDRPVTACEFGSLVGRIGSGSWFCVGSEYRGVATTAGVLTLAANDDDRNNCATGRLSVQAGAYEAWIPTSPEDDGWVNTSTPTFTWPAVADDGSGAVTYTLVVHGRTVASGLTGTSHTVTTALSDSDHEWYVVATDAVGNERVSSTFTVNVDTQAPDAFAISNLACSRLLTPELCWTASDDDDSELASYDVYIDDVLVSSVAPTADCITTLVASGVHDWYVVAADNAGNTTTTDTGTFSIGANPEVCDGVDNDCDGAWYGATVDEVSGGAESGDYNRLRGNKVRVTTSTSLQAIEAYLEVSEGTDLTWAVYEGATETGTFTLVATVTTIQSVSTTDWVSSGTLPVALVAGRYYVLAVVWARPTSAFEDATPSLPVALSFGEIVDGVGVGRSSPASTATFTAYGKTVDFRFVTGGEADADEDGVPVCESDCDDTDPATYPGAAEACDAIDNDCDGTVPTDELDADGDTIASCAGDCDDAVATVHPGAAEGCDAIDSDCDGSIPTIELDGDGDGYSACGGDCDDAAATVSPVGTEVVANGVDEDCDTVDACYADGDGDGYGAATVVDGSSLDCLSGTGATSSDDCDDGDAAIHPAATELCDAADVDEDCDRLADDADASATGFATFYVDADGDGHGSATPGAFCDLPSGYALAATDCDDGDAAYHPGADESDCTDPNDYNCDGSVAYEDADADGHPACTDCDDRDVRFHPGADESDCTDPSDYNCDGSVGYTDADADGSPACGDCDDAEPRAYPGASEAAGDGIDGDCDGAELCYVDADGDGYRSEDEATVPGEDLACDGDGEATAELPGGDCDDDDSAWNPGAVESDCTDPNDYNCDGSVGYADADEDGHAACTECDDADDAVNPDATEVCNGLDDDCDGTIDAGATDASAWYADADGDGATNPTDGVTACDPPEGYAALGAEDCDDADSTAFPGGDDVPDDGVDQDCDGADAVGPGGGKDGGGEACGCATGGEGAAWLVVAVAGALLARRRR